MSINGPSLVNWSELNAAGVTDRSASLDYPSPFFRFEAYNLPGTIKSLWSFLSYVYLTDSNVSPVIENTAAYPVTKLIYEDVVDEIVKKSWDHLLINVLDVRNKMIAMGYDYYLYGGSFSSVYIPFTRYLICNSCKTPHNLDVSTNQWSFSSVKWMVKCIKCKSEKESTAFDAVNTTTLNKFKIINWNVYNLTLKRHPYSQSVDVGYDIPQEVRKQITSGNKQFISRTPLDIITQTQFHYCGTGPANLPLSEDSVFYFQRQTPSMPSSEQIVWGMPLAVASLRQIYFKNILLRAQAMVMHEHILPFRIFYPTSPTGDPLDIPGSEWKDAFLKAHRKFLRDPSTVMTSMIPTQMLQAGGQGKALTLFPEIDQTDRNIVKGMNAIPGLIDGSAQFANNSVSLRMMENLMLNYTEHLNRFLEWLVDKLSKLTGLPKVKVSLQPFKMVDDIQMKSLYVTLYNMGLVSGEYLGQVMDFDAKSEAKKRIEEQRKQAEAQAISQGMGQMVVQRSAEAMQTPAPEAFGRVQSPVPPDQTQDAYMQIKQMSPKKQQKTMDLIGKQNPLMAKGISDLNQMSPQNSMNLLARLQSLPPEISQQIMDDISNNSPLVAKMLQTYIEAFSQPQQSQPNQQVDMRPAPQQRPPRRDNKTM